jgi:hypothetical protein
MATRISWQTWRATTLVNFAEARVRVARFALTPLGESVLRPQADRKVAPSCAWCARAFQDGDVVAIRNGELVHGASCAAELDESETVAPERVTDPDAEGRSDA